jgi:hypothetical protein
MWPSKGKRCSFCHKTVEEGRFSSAPSDYRPRAHICDECVHICSRRLNWPDRPDISELLLLIKEWVATEQVDPYRSATLHRIRRVAEGLFGDAGYRSPELKPARSVVSSRALSAGWKGSGGQVRGWGLRLTRTLTINATTLDLYDPDGTAADNDQLGAGFYVASYSGVASETHGGQAGRRSSN